MRTEQDTDPVWQLPAGELSLPRDEVHVWQDDIYLATDKKGLPRMARQAWRA